VLLIVLQEIGPDIMIAPNEYLMFCLILCTKLDRSNTFVAYAAGCMVL